MLITPRLNTKEIVIYSGPLLLLFTVTLIAALFKNEHLFHSLNELAMFRPLLWLHLTHFGNVLIVVSLFGIFIVNHPKLLWSLAISMVLSTLIVQGLKHTIDAPRPPAVLAVDKIRVIVPTRYILRTPNPNVDYESLIDARQDTAATWEIIQSDPHSLEASYWIPRMDGVVTKEQFGIAFSQETLDIEQGIYRGIYRPSARSFPSGHTATIACALTLVMLYFRKRKWSWGLALVALVVGGSRVVVGVHWPLDVAVGGLIGWAAASAGIGVSLRTSVTSTLIGHRVVALLPGVAGVILIIRKPIYPDIALFETIVGVGGLILAATSLWLLYRKA